MPIDDLLVAAGAFGVQLLLALTLGVLALVPLDLFVHVLPFCRPSSGAVLPPDALCLAAMAFRPELADRRRAVELAARGHVLDGEIGFRRVQADLAARDANMSGRSGELRG